MPSRIVDLPPDASLPLADVPDTFARPEDDPLGNVTENEDGSATIEDPVAEGQEDTGFYDNLAESLDAQELTDLAADLLEKIELDRESRKKRDEQYEEGLRRTGLGDDAPGGAQFSGSSKVVHPLLAEACIDFSARTMKELFPAKGPVKSQILSKADTKAIDRANLKTKVLNWQLSKQMREYREEMEQLTTQEPMGGSQYLKIWHNAAKRRHQSEFIPIDKLLLPYAASGLYSAERATHVQDITRQTFDARVKSGLYRDVEIGDGAEPFPEKTKAETANEKIEGKSEDPYNEDGLRQVYEIYVNWMFEDDAAPKPYIVHIDDYTEEVLGVYRNWEESDERCEKLDWIVEFKFIPWRGAYGIGLPHLIGGISGALTGALRALLDSAHINNAATMLKLKGIRGSGSNTSVEVTQVCEIEAPPQVDDIRKVAMPMPFNPPSPVLFQLLGFLNDAATGVVSTADEKIGDVSSNMPVGTTMALIEQGSQVYSSIHTRHHFAQQRALDIICRLNKQYPEVLEDASIALKAPIDPDLFDDNSDIQPVSDPNIFSETQRYAQIQAVCQALSNPAIAPKVDQVALTKMVLQRLKFDQADEVLPDDPKATKNDPVSENVLATKGLPLAAFMDQDHIAHLIVHLDFCDSPLFGANPSLTVPAVPTIMAHCSEHFAMFYSMHMKAAVSAYTEIHGAAEMDQANLADGVKNAVAMAQQQMAQALAPIMPMLQNAQKLAASAAPKPPMDPASQVQLQLGQQKLAQDGQAAQANSQMKAQEMQQNFQIRQQELQHEQQMDQMNAQLQGQAKQLEEQRLAQQDAFDKQIQLMEQARMRDHEIAMQQAEVYKNDETNRQHQLTELTKNREDNNTQIIIEAMKQQLQAMAPQVAEATAGNTAMNSTNDPDMMTKLQKILESSTQAAAQNQHHEATQAILQGLHGIMKHVASPKQVVRDAQGNIVGVQNAGV